VEALLNKDVEKAVFYAKNDVQDTKEQVLRYLYDVKKEIEFVMARENE
jgi:hypothetical protein